MRKIIIGLTLTGLLAVPLIGLAQAAGAAPTLDIMDVLDRITNWLFTILLIIAAIFIIIAAYFFVTAQGDPEKTKKARDFVLYALVGVLVAFCAKGLVMLVKTMVGA